MEIKILIPINSRIESMNGLCTFNISKIGRSSFKEKIRSMCVRNIYVNYIDI